MWKTMKGLVGVISLAAGVSCGGGATPSVSEPTLNESVVDREDINDRFAGTWELVKVERFDADDQLIPPSEPPGFGREGSVGYITYDRAGYMGVVIMGPDRQPYADEGPTPDEARASLADYTSYFGPYTVNEEERHITHHLVASLSPNGAGNDNRRDYEFHDDQLTLRPPRGDSGVQLAITWRRVPDANLTAEQQKFVGFWEIRHVERRSADGESEDVPQFASGYLIYTAAGHMQVHLARPDRARFVSTPPSDEEVVAAVRSYVSYFGPFRVDEAAQLVTHERVGTTTPSAGRPAPFRRNYEFRENLLILSPVPPEGSNVRSYLTWERLGN